jgi:hypothetical protein
MDVSLECKRTLYDQNWRCLCVSLQGPSDGFSLVVKTHVYGTNDFGTSGTRSLTHFKVRLPNHTSYSAPIDVNPTPTTWQFRVLYDYLYMYLYILGVQSSCGPSQSLTDPSPGSVPHICSPFPTLVVSCPPPFKFVQEIFPSIVTTGIVGVVNRRMIS